MSEKLQEWWNQAREADLQQVLTIAWLGIQLALVGFVVSAFSAAANVYAVCSDQVDRRESFVRVWIALLGIGISVGGTMVLRRFRTAPALGFFLGLVVLMANWMLCTAMLSGSEGSRKVNQASLGSSCPQHSTTADTSVTVFSVFLFLLYSVFGAALAKYIHNNQASESDYEDVGDGQNFPAFPFPGSTGADTHSGRGDPGLDAGGDTV